MKKNIYKITFYIFITCLIIINLTSCTKEKKAIKYIEETITQLTLPEATNEKINLVNELEGIKVTWESSNPKILNTTGELNLGNKDEEVTLTGTFIYNEVSYNKEYKITILHEPNQALLDAYNFYQATIPTKTYKNFNLITDSYQNAIVIYQSTNETRLSSTGIITQGTKDEEVDFLCTITLNGVTKTFTKKVTVLTYCEEQKQEEQTAYINKQMQDFIMPSETEEALDLVNAYKDLTIAWSTTDELVIEANGDIFAYSTSHQASLIASVTYLDTVVEFEYPITVLPIYNTYTLDTAWTYYDKAIPNKAIQNIILTDRSYYYCNISYQVSDESILSLTGEIHQKSFDQTVTLYCYIKSPKRINKIFTKDITISGYTDLQKINLISAWLDELVPEIKTNNLDVLPITHGEFGGTISWYSPSIGFISNDGYISLPTTLMDVDLQVSITMGIYNSINKYHIEQIGGSTTMDEQFTSWLKQIMPRTIKGTLNTVNPDNDEFVSQERTKDKGILNLIDGSSITINKDYMIDVFDTSKTIVSKMYGSGTLNTDIHPVTPQTTLDGYFGEGYIVPNNLNIIWITVHESGMPKVNNDALLLASMQYRYAYTGAAREASWHYQVDEKAIYQSYDDNIICWHASDGTRTPGNGNNNSIGIEMCINQDGNYEGAMRNDAKLIAYLLNKYNLTVDHVKRHYDFAPDKKKCPNYMIMTNRWEEFLNLVYYEYMALKYFNNAVVKWELSTDTIQNTDQVLNTYFTYLSHNMWEAKKVTTDITINVKLTVEKDGQTYITTSEIKLFK